MKSFLLALLLAVPSAYALEIPLTGAAGTEGSAKIGYVDMERIFQVYPQTKSAKDDYRKRLEKLKLDLAQKETELGNIRDRIAVLDSTLKGTTPPGATTPPAPTDPNAPAADANTPSTPPAPDAAPDSVSALRKDLETKQTEYEDARKRALEDLSQFESKQSQIILGKIYQALVDLAQEEQLTIVVDKSSILYGSAATDLTERLQEKIRGF